MVKVIVTLRNLYSVLSLTRSWCFTIITFMLSVYWARYSPVGVNKKQALIRSAGEKKNNKKTQNLGTLHNLHLAHTNDKIIIIP